MNFTARVTSRASKVTPSIFRQARIAALGLASVTLTALFLVPTSVPAAATPPVTVAEAKALVAQLRTDAGAIDQQYSGVVEQIKQGRAQLRAEASRCAGADREGRTHEASGRPGRARSVPKSQP